MEKETARLIRISVFVIISSVSLFLCVLYVFYSSSLEQHHVRLDSKTGALLIIAALPWVIERIESFRGFGVEFTQRLDKQEDKINEQQELLNAMFWYSMEKDMFDTLQNLIEQPTFTHNPADTTFYPIVNGQLKELFNKGYVSKEPADISQNENIGAGKIVTATGKRFVEERKKLESSGALERLRKLKLLDSD